MSKKIATMTIDADVLDLMRLKFPNQISKMTNDYFKHLINNIENTENKDLIKLKEKKMQHEEEIKEFVMEKNRQISYLNEEIRKLTIKAKEEEKKRQEEEAILEAQVRNLDNFLEATKWEDPKDIKTMRL